MATLNIINNISMTSQGSTTVVKQGTSTDDATSAFAVTVTGTKHELIGSLATATVVTVFDDDDDVPADWDYMIYWADQDSYIQFIGSATNAIFKVLAKVPFTLTYDSVLAAANTTIITGGAEPSVTDIDSIVIGNYSGSTMNFRFCVID